MKALVIVVLLLSFATIPFAQIHSDTLEGTNDISLKGRFLAETHYQPGDSIGALDPIASIRDEFNAHSDSVQSEYRKEAARIDSEKSRLKKTIDSLQRLGLRTRKYTKNLRSLDELREKAERKFIDKFHNIKLKALDKLTALNLRPEDKGPLNQVTNKIKDLNPTSGKIRLDELNISGFSSPTGAISNVREKTNDVVNINVIDLPHIRTGDVANELQNDINNVLPENAEQVVSEFQGYEQDIKNIAQGNLADIEKLSGALESEASKIEGMDELQKQSGVIPKHKATLQDFKDSEEAKKKAVEIAKKAAVDHFAGKDEQLKAAMEKIAKYKQKYPSAPSIKDLPKRPPNAMKGKPLIERLSPGLYLQYQQKNLYLLDVNPYVGYKISGRFTAGLGWNHRYTYNNDSRSFNSHSSIFGPRGYFDSKLGKGFIAHLEGEAMNAFVPSTLIGNPDNGHREWVWSFMTGLKKEYKIYKNLKGTALIQYNWFNRYYKAPYVDRLNSRIGFEYTIKGREGKTSGT